MEPVNNVGLKKEGTVMNMDSKIAGFLNTFDSKLNELIAFKLDNIKLQALSLKSALASGSIKTPNDIEIVTFLDKTSSIIDDKEKDPLNKALAVGYSFGSGIKINKQNISQDSKMKEGISRMIFDYLDIAKASSDPGLQSIAISVAEDFQSL
jgi:hypothetical protein